MQQRAAADTQEQARRRRRAGLEPPQEGVMIRLPVGVIQQLRVEADLEDRPLAYKVRSLVLTALALREQESVRGR